MEVIEKNINEVIPYFNNPRCNEEAVEFVANSIKDFGFNRPIVIDNKNVIICGHTRLKAAKKLGFQTVPCVVANNLTNEQIVAYRLADNKLQELSSFDLEALETEFNKIGSWDMAKYGFFLDDMEIEEIANIEEEREQNNKRNRYQIKISCEDKKQAKSLLEKFEGLGYKCRIQK